MPSQTNDITILHENPFLVEFCLDITIEQMQTFIENQSWQASQGWDFDSGQSKLTAWRSSETFFDYAHHFDHLRDRLLLQIASVVGHRFDSKNCEPIQLTKYGPGDFYKPHYDNFNLDGVTPITNDRIATAIIYLNDDFQGGHTSFGNLGIKVVPKAGKVLFFFYPKGTKSASLLHEAEIVTTGHKYIATLWIRQNFWEGNL